MEADGVVADAPLRLFCEFDLGDQVAHGRIPSGECNAGRLADQAASSVAADEILCPQRLAVGERDVDAGVVLREAGHLASAMDRHAELIDPAGQDALDVVLPEPERVGMPGGKVADIQSDAGELPDVRHLSLAEEPIRDSALIEDLDAARMQAAGARAGELLAVAPFDNGNVDARQRQLARQHQTGRARARDQDIRILCSHEAAPVLFRRGAS